MDDKKDIPGTRKEKGDGRRETPRSEAYIIDGKRVGKKAFDRHMRKEKKVKARAFADTIKDLTKKLKVVTRERDKLNDTVGLAATTNISLQDQVDQARFNLLEVEGERAYYKEIVDNIMEATQEHGKLVGLNLSATKDGDLVADTEFEVGKEDIEKVLPIGVLREDKEAGDVLFLDDIIHDLNEPVTVDASDPDGIKVVKPPAPDELLDKEDPRVETDDGAGIQEIGIDPAKPGADKTVVTLEDTKTGRKVDIKEVCDEALSEFARKQMKDPKDLEPKGGED